MTYKVKLTNKQLFKAFQIDMRQYFKMRARLLYHLRLQPSEYENAPFYEYQYYVKDLIDILKERNDGEDDNKYNVDNTYDKMKQDSSKYTKGMKGMGGNKMPKMPSIPKLR